MQNIYILFIIVGIILLLATIFLIINAKNKLKNYNECVGIIKDFYKSDSELRVGNDAEISVSPIIEYKIGDKTLTFKGNYCSTSMKIGDNVKILYDKNSINKAVIKKGLYFVPTITGILTLFMAFIAILFYILRSI